MKKRLGGSLVPGAVGALAAVAIGLMDGLIWHDEPPAAKAGDPSLWQIIFHSPVVLGFIRVGLVGAAIYVFASVVALGATGRWITKAGASGFEVGETLQESESQLQKSEQALVAMRRERDEALRQARTALKVADSLLAARSGEIPNAGDR